MKSTPVSTRLFERLTIKLTFLYYWVVALVCSATALLVGCGHSPKKEISETMQSSPPRFGSAMFAIQHEDYPCEDALKQFKGSRIKFTSVLATTFGHSKDCLIKFLSLPSEYTEVQIYFENGAGRRNERLADNEILPYTDIRDYALLWEEGNPLAVNPYRERVRSWAEFAQRFHGPKVQFSGILSLEDNQTLSALREQIKVAREIWPYELGWNPVNYNGGIESLDIDFIELHGDTVNFPTGIPCRSNLDGLQPNLGRFPELQLSVRTLSDTEVGYYLDSVSQLCNHIQLWDQGISNGGYPGASFRPPLLRSFDFNISVIEFINNTLSTRNGVF